MDLLTIVGHWPPAESELRCGLVDERKCVLAADVVGTASLVPMANEARALLCSLARNIRSSCPTVRYDMYYVQ